jgi:lysozyme family protein
MTDEQIITSLLATEAGYVDNPADKGGPTNFGITQMVLTAWRGTVCTPADVKAMSSIEASAIYMDRFIKSPGFDRILDDPLRAAVVDAGVQHSPARAARWLQELAGVQADGLFGPVSATAVNALDPRQARARFIATRARFYGRIIADDANKLAKDRGIHTQGEFAAGWMDRCADFIELLG